jgi:cytochrome c5
MRALSWGVWFFCGFASLGHAAEPSGPDGRAVYEDRCRFCHDVGVRGAPQPGNRFVWPKPTEENIDMLAHKAKCGERVMPPMGTCKHCTIDDIKAAIRYMIEYRP